MENVTKKKLLTPDKIKQLKKKRPDERRKSLTVKDLLKEKRVDLNMTTASVTADEKGSGI